VAAALVVLGCACAPTAAQAAAKSHSTASCHKRIAHHRGKSKCSGSPGARQVRLRVWELPIKGNRLTREEVHRLVAEARATPESHGAPLGQSGAGGNGAAPGHGTAPGHGVIGKSLTPEQRKEAEEARKEAEEARKEAEEEALEAAQEAAEEAAERAEELRARR
jgi:hypothetical protein